jgi:hypothetical protein
MPTLRQATQVANKFPPMSAAGTEDVTLVGDYTVEAGLVINDVVEMVILPAGYVPSDAAAYLEDTDSNGAPTITLDLGIITGVAGAVDNTRTCGNEGFLADVTAKTGGVARAAKKDWGLIAPANTDRGLGFKVSAAAATLTVGAKWRLCVPVRAQRAGV